MLSKRTKLAIIISTLVVVTVLIAISVASLILWSLGDWEKHHKGLTLTLKIMWGSWIVLFTATFLTWVTIFGWHFRRAWPDRGPMALLRSVAAGVQPPSWLKTGWTSFTITVVLVSLAGTAVLASVLIWILGNWNRHSDSLTLALKLIWGIWWVLCIATVLVRIAIFDRQKRALERARAMAAQPANEDTPQAKKSIGEPDATHE